MEQFSLKDRLIGYLSFPMVSWEMHGEPAGQSTFEIRSIAKVMDGELFVFFQVDEGEDLNATTADF